MPVTKKTRAKGRKNPKTSSVRKQLNDGPSYAGQQVARLRLPTVSIPLATTITTGVLANAFIVQVSNIVAFTTRFGGTFDEYRILVSTLKFEPSACRLGSLGFGSMKSRRRRPQSPTRRSVSG